MNREQASSLFRKLKIPLCFSGDGVVGWVMLDGRKVVPLRFPNSNFELSAHTVMSMRQLLRLDQGEFTQLYSCTLSFKEFLILLRQRLADEERRNS